MKTTKSRNLLTKIIRILVITSVAAFLTTTTVLAEIRYVSPMVGAWSTYAPYSSDRAYCLPYGEEVNVVSDDGKWSTIYYDGIGPLYIDSSYLSQSMEFQDIIITIYDEFTLNTEDYSTSSMPTYYNTVVVSIAEQKLQYYSSNGEILLDVPVITGNPNKGYDTVTGNFTILDKKWDAYLSGEDYQEVHVTQWLPFYGGYGIHAADWQWDFTPSSYLTNGSHGCVNMRTSDAEALWKLVEIGTPVIVQ